MYLYARIFFHSIFQVNTYRNFCLIVSGDATRPSACHNEITSPHSNRVEISSQAGECHSHSSVQPPIPNPDQIDIANSIQSVHLYDLPSLDQPSDHNNQVETSSKAGSASETHSHSNVQAPILKHDRMDADNTGHVHSVHLDDPSNRISNDGSSQSV